MSEYFSTEMELLLQSFRCVKLERQPAASTVNVVQPVLQALLTNYVMSDRSRSSDNFTHKLFAEIGTMSIAKSVIFCKTVFLAIIMS